MAFAILRVAKLKTMGNISGHGSHVERQRETLNADPAKLDLNQRLAGTDDPAADVKVRFDEMQIEPRKGAVVAIDVFITASPEHFNTNHPDDPNWKAFQDKAMAFLRQEYGAANVVHAIAHHDETSPHLHAIVTPIRSKTIKVGRAVKKERTENRLCARDWLGGDRITLSKLQSRFADHVKDLGLTRGIEGSGATHTQVKQFYTLMKETTEKAQAIQLALAPIEKDYYVKAVDKPRTIDRIYQHDYAKYQVEQALSKVSSQIEQTNKNAETARRGQLVSLQTPVTDALIQKGQTRQSQAEQALAQLGYRLNVHGQLENILEERQKALRTTLTRSLGKCTTIDELRADLAGKGIKMGFSKDHQETYQGKSYNGVVFNDGQGKLWGHELGPDYTTLRIVEQLTQLAIQRERAEREKAYQATFNQVLADYFKLHKGDASKVARMLATTTPQQRQDVLNQFTQVHGPEGAKYARQQFEKLYKMTDFQLAAERDSLKKAGHDVGLDKGLKIRR
ncbi:MobV family relaxase [Spirosoma endophyticum]|uniref:Plasmid recombination enzyme n=1 Tax=Spirosoma endophyticum TaxID=662367 RepID=A0A1I2IAS9_9BACT|nr:MobV family relaxase [Spirosoma endophyticum]SFF39469.1 Plasmid recombination enzyme [Spirosoma endophyticum]